MADHASCFSSIRSSHQCGAERRPTPPTVPRDRCPMARRSSLRVAHPVLYRFHQSSQWCSERRGTVRWAHWRLRLPLGVAPQRMHAVSAERAVQVGARPHQRCQRPRGYLARHRVLDAAAASVNDPADLAPLATSSALFCAAIAPSCRSSCRRRPRGAERGSGCGATSPGHAGPKRSLLT